MHALVTSLVLSSVGLLLVLAARKPAQHLLGAGPAFSLWLLPVLLAITPWLPALPTHWSAPRAIATLPGIRVLLMPETIVDEAARPTFGVLWLWLGGSALLLIRLIAHHYRIRRNSTPPSPPLLRALRPWMHPRQRQRVRLHPMGPAVLWSPRSLVLLPDDFLQRFTPTEQQAVIAHECAHLRRGDAWWSLLAELGLALLWFHPLAWIALPRLRLDMELACDAAVLRLHPDMHALYAQALLRNADVPVLTNLVAWFNPPQLKERLTMISRMQRNPLQNRCGYIALAVMLTAGTFAAQAIASPAGAGGPLFAQSDQAGVTSNGVSVASTQTSDADQTKAQGAVTQSSGAVKRVVVFVDPHTSPTRRDALRRKFKQAGISHVEFSTRDEMASTPIGEHPRATAGNHPPTAVESSRLQNPPVYPREALRRSAEGVVTLGVYVNTQGEPLKVRIDKSSGSKSLDSAAANAAGKWHYHPAVRHGKAEAGWAQISIMFHLDA